MEYLLKIHIWQVLTILYVKCKHFFLGCLRMNIYVQINGQRSRLTNTHTLTHAWWVYIYLLWASDNVLFRQKYRWYKQISCWFRKYWRKTTKNLITWILAKYRFAYEKYLLCVFPEFASFQTSKCNEDHLNCLIVRGRLDLAKVSGATNKRAQKSFRPNNGQLIHKNAQVCLPCYKTCLPFNPFACFAIIPLAQKLFSFLIPFHTDFRTTTCVSGKRIQATQMNWFHTNICKKHTRTQMSTKTTGNIKKARIADLRVGDSIHCAIWFSREHTHWQFYAEFSWPFVFLRKLDVMLLLL